MTPDDLYKQRALLARTANDVAKGQLSREDVDDLISDTFVEALEHMVDGREMTAAWLKLRVAGRTYDLLKSKQFELNVPLDNKLTNKEGEELDGLPENLIDRDTPEGLYAVREFIEGLSDEDREIIEMLVERDDGERPQVEIMDEIADEMGLGRATVYRRIEKYKGLLSE